MNLIFNPEYVLKTEDGAVLMMPKENMISSDTMSDSNFFMRIHSIHAAILSFFDGRKTEEAFSAAADFLKIPADSITDFIERLTNNEERLGVNFKGEIIQFPKKCLILSDEKRTECYDPAIFDYQNLHFGLQRHMTPTDITLMVNTRCSTDCIYCYADRRKLIDCQVPLERIKELIREAKSLQVRSFDVIGGEYMLYKHWKELLVYLLENGFDPFISTKVPVGEDAVRSLKEIGGKGLQVSLDTLNPATAVSLLKVKPDYVEKMKQTLRLLDSYGVSIFIHSIITRLNDTPENAASIYGFIKELKNVKIWRLDLPSVSLYKNKDTFLDDLRPNKENLARLADYLKTLTADNDHAFEIKNSLELPVKNIDPVERKASAAKKFQERSICSANFSSMFILPDGQVTVCEELYWDKRFIIGDVNRQGLKEIWDSEESHKQFFIKQEDIPDDSPCKTCDEFEQCRRTQGVCYRDVIKSYGEDKWYYPDANCPKAPEVLYEIM